jgi:hypothetical protein
MNLKIFKNKHKDEDCVILACGPSLKEYDKNIVKNFLKNKKVFCLKETIFEFELECNYFVFNRFRCQNYNITNKNIISIGQFNKGGPSMQNKIDILIPYVSDFKKTSILQSKDFEKNNFDNQLHRTWGPGIMLETTLYMCMYMGFKNVFTIGWDNTDPNNIGSVTHFSDFIKSEKYKNTRNISNTDYKKEMTLYANNVIHAYNYFKNKNMNIYVVGHKSFIDKNIPRVYLT